MVHSLEAWCLLVHFVDSVVSERQGGMWLAGMCVDAKELSHCGCFSSVFLESVSNACGKRRQGGEDHGFGRMDGTVQLSIGEGEPEMARAGDEEVDCVRFTDALKLDVINVEFERHLFVDGAIGLERFKAVEGHKEHGHDASCSHSAVWLCGRAYHPVVLHPASASVALDG